MRRTVKSMVSLASAYAFLGALLLGSIAVGDAAASPVPICHGVSSGASDSLPAAPVHRDLTCLVTGCCGCATPALVPPATFLLGSPSFAEITWPGHKSEFIPHSVAAALSARGPPSLS